MTRERILTWAAIIAVGLITAYCVFPVEAAEPAHKQDTPPLFSMGVFVCGKPWVLWIVADTIDGKNTGVLRFDKEHPVADDQYDAFMLWIATGPTDFIEAPCHEKAKP